MYGVSNIFCKHRDLNACLILKMIAPTSLSHRRTWGTQWSSASHPTIHRVWNANGQVIIPMTQSGKMSPPSRNRLFKCLKMQGKVGEAEYKIICAMATNTCNPSFPRLQIQVLMPWSCMTWDLTCHTTLKPEELFLGMFYMNYWAVFFILPLPASNQDNTNILPKATDPNGTEVTLFPSAFTVVKSSWIPQRIKNQ